MQRKIWTPNNQDVADALKELVKAKEAAIGGEIKVSESVMINILIMDAHKQLSS
jgi:hypothetical protein